MRRERCDEEVPVSVVLAEGDHVDSFHVRAALNGARDRSDHRAELRPFRSTYVTDGLGMATQLKHDAGHDLMRVRTDTPVIALVQPSARQAALSPVAVVAPWLVDQ